MDQFPRIASYNCLTVVQVVSLVCCPHFQQGVEHYYYFFLMLFSCQAAAQLLSVGMIIHGHTTCSTPVSCLLVQPWFVVLVIAGAIERLSGLALGVAMERDWVVLVLLTSLSFVLIFI